jgi:hypothetical protein
MRAGGRATEAGMSFQAEVGSYLAAQMLASALVGQRYGLTHSEHIVGLRLETGKGVDDAVASLSGGGFLKLQCKTSLSLSSDLKSDFTKTIGQFVDEVIADPAIDPLKTALIIALPVGSGATIDTLAAACARVAAGGLSELHVASEAEQKAFETFKIVVDRSWAATAAAGVSPPYHRFAQLLRVVHFDRGATGFMRSDGAALLGRTRFGGDAHGASPFTTLIDIVRDLIKSGHPTDTDRLLTELRKRGHHDVGVPGFDTDIEKLLAYSQAETARLARFAQLPLGGYRLERACEPSLARAVDDGSLLVIGEPGAGKSGLLWSLADRWRRGPVIVLSVDQLGGVQRMADLSNELKLDHDLTECCAAWPGDAPGLLVIDALDAARGGQAEVVLIQLIERMAALAPRWRVVASVRTFDLLNGQRLRSLMPGLPASADFADGRAPHSRHFLIPALTSDERARIAGDLPALAPVLGTANANLSALLANIFNLSLATDLIANGVAADSFSGVSTQSDLIDRYEDRRLPGIAARSALIAGIKAMIDIGGLSLRAAELDHPGLEALLGSGIFDERDDRYSFAHHILFDHAAGRYFIDISTGANLISQLKSLGSKAFMLAPALRFSLERLWRRDASHGRQDSWTLLMTLAQQRDLGPIAAAAALRTAAEQVAAEEDLAGLDPIIAKEDSKALNRVFFQIARFVAMRAQAEAIPASALIAWAGFAERIALLKDRFFVEPARFLLMPLFEKADLTEEPILLALGDAARAGLANAFAQDATYRHARAMGIDFVAKSFASNPAASRAALAPFLDAAWLAEHGHEDAPALARGLQFIVPIDGGFAEQIFRAIYEQPEPSDEKTDMSGSRILSLTSTRRQDFKHAFHYLKKAFRQTLSVDPLRAPALLSIAATAKQRCGADRPVALLLPIETGAIEVLPDCLDVLDWRQPRGHGDPADPDIPEAFARYAASCKSEELVALAQATMSQSTAASVWRRILGGQLTSARRGPADDLLWQVAAQPISIESRELRRDAIDYLRAVYPQVPVERREAFERAIAAHTPEHKRSWQHYRDRLVSALPAVAIVTSTLKRRRSLLVRKGELQVNPAEMSMSGSRIMRPARNAPDRSLVSRAIRSIDRRSDQYRATKAAGRLPPLWSALQSAVRLAGSGKVTGDDLASLWGRIAEGLTLLAGSCALKPGEAGAPPLDEIGALLSRLVASPYPEGDGNSLSSSPGDVRVHAAEAAMTLGRRYLHDTPGLLDIIRLLLSDANGAVRNNATERLFWLQSIDPDVMWQLVQSVADQETHRGVLTFFVHHSLARLSDTDPARVEALLASIDARSDLMSDSISGDLTQTIAHLATEMAVDDDRAVARAMIDRWISAAPVESDAICDVMQMFRSRFFYGYLPSDDPRREAGRRARSIGQATAFAASSQLSDAKVALVPLKHDDPKRPPFIDAYIGADKVLHELVTQLYFGSGAHGPETPTELSLNRSEQKLAFLDEWSDALLEVERVATPHTIKYLVEVYEYLLPADPARLFSRIGAFLTGPAAEEYYESEQLAAADLVKFVRQMIADYRDLFDDGAQRDLLVTILELFADAGWPEAMQLLWELPDLLR